MACVTLLDNNTDQVVFVSHAGSHAHIDKRFLASDEHAQVVAAEELDEVAHVVLRALCWHALTDARS